MFKTILLEKKDNGVAIITLNRPEVLNALNKEVFADLDKCLDDIARDAAVKVVVITGAGDRAFAAGADISSMLPMDAVQAQDWATTSQKVLDKIEFLPQPVIAAVNGFALGGGNEVSMACDIRIASDKAKLGQPEPTLGVTPGFGGTQRLPRLIGRGRAMYLLCTAAAVNAATALEWGLVDMVFPHAELMTKVMEIAAQIAAQPNFAIRQIKYCAVHGLEASLPTGLLLEASAFGVCFATKDQKECMRAFVEKKKK